MPPKLPLPRGWQRRLRSAVLHISAPGTTACPHQLERLASPSFAGYLRVSTPNMPFSSVQNR